MRSPEKVSFLELWIVATVFLLGLWGVLTVASAQSTAAEPLALPLRQLCRLLLALAALVLAWRVPFAVYRKLTPVLAVLGYGVLLVLPLVGERINGMRGWVALWGIQIQPSELSKPFFLLSLIFLNGLCRDDRRRLLVLSGATLIWTLPVMVQPDFGTTVIYWCGFLAVYVLTARRWQLAALPVTGMLLLAAGFVWSRPYAWRRLAGFFDPESDALGSGWHIRQFQLAMAHGDWFGAKMQQAVWSNYYLPLAYNDSAYATMVETLGVAGSLPALVLAGLLAFFLYRLAVRSVHNEFARVYIAGAALLLLSQTLVHLGVNATLLPPTGLTWPFISYGGSSLLSCGLLVGIALSAGSEESGR